MAVRRRAAGAARAAVAEVVVVGPDDDGLVGQRPGAFQHADHVLQRDRLGVALRRRCSAVQPVSAKLSRLQVAVDRLLDVGELLVGRQHRLDHGALEQDGRQVLAAAQESP